MLAHSWALVSMRTLWCLRSKAFSHRATCTPVLPRDKLMGFILVDCKPVLRLCQGSPSTRRHNRVKPLYGSIIQDCEKVLYDRYPPYLGGLPRSGNTPKRTTGIVEVSVIVQPQGQDALIRIFFLQIKMIIIFFGLVPVWSNTCELIFSCKCRVISLFACNLYVHHRGRASA